MLAVGTWHLALFGFYYLVAMALPVLASKSERHIESIIEQFENWDNRYPLP